MPTAPPPLLIDAFRALEQPTDIGVLMDDEGFDATTMRVYSAWEKSSHVWNRPATPCPDDGRPTTAAWNWLRSGWSIDVGGIAEGAGVARETARELLTVLLRARLIYPDGSSSKHARQALTATVAMRLTKAGAGKKKKAEAAGTGNDGGKAN